MVKKDRSAFVNKTYLMKNSPLFYQAHLESQLERPQYLILTILINLLQSIKQVRLEALATAFPFPIQFDSRRRKIQRFLSLPQLTIETIWFPIFSKWLSTNSPVNQVLYIAIDRTSWRCTNILMISLIWDKRSIPLYWKSLDKLGSSNLSEQTDLLLKVLPLLKGYKTVV